MVTTGGGDGFADLDHGIFVRIVIETVNGMAKMVPMTEHQMRRAGW